MIGVHEKIKFGDLIYIEIYDKEHVKYSLSSSGFSLSEKSPIELSKLKINHKNAYLKDFENNLFVIFPTMQDSFLSNKALLDETIQYLVSKLKFSSNLLNDSDIKENINKLIKTYQETKNEVYKHNNILTQSLIGKPIIFGENFILIHMKSQMLISSNSEDNINDNANDLILSLNYTEDSIFQFYPFNKYDKIESEVYSNQNIHIRKTQRSIWANNPYLYYTISDNVTKYNRMMIHKQNSIKIHQPTKKHSSNLILLTEEYEIAKKCPFQIKICSNYIDPSSTNLSFSNPFWMVCQFAEKYLVVKQFINSQSETSIKITYAPIDKDKLINNINGLFNIEQIDTNYKHGNGLRMPPYIEFNKSIRFRHSATKKYLSFVETDSGRENNIESNKTKIYGTLLLKDIPDSDCEWMFMESYKILNREKYVQAKSEGMSLSKNKLHDNNNVAKIEEQKMLVKKKDILRIFHIKSNKFLSFEDVIGIEDKEIGNQTDRYNSFKHDITLNKLPLDNDLIKLSPSNESQSWEIHLIWYFSETLENLVKKCQNDFRNLIDISENKFYDKSHFIDLNNCFEALTDFCLNRYIKRYDYTVSSDKPVYYRQNLLRDQGFLDMTINFLSSGKEFISNKINEENALNALNDLNTIKKKKKENVSHNVKTDLNKEMSITFTKSFEFISAICKSNPDNKEFVFQKRHVFKNYLLMYKEASDCLMGIIKDDESYMSEVFHDKIMREMNNSNNLLDEISQLKSDPELKGKENNIIDLMIDYLNRSKVYEQHTLSLLSKLMKSKNKGITSVQESIYKKLFEEKKDNLLLKIKSKYDDLNFYVVFKSNLGESISKNFLELCKTGNTLSEYDQNIVLYLSTQLNMYANMCYGRNYVCIEKIREFFPLDHLIYHIANINIHEEILVGLLKILNYAYIDIAPHSEIIYPSIIKIVECNMEIERINKQTVETFIPLDKLNLILCICLYILYNIKHDKLLVNTANIHLILNLIKFKLYDNVEYNNVWDINYLNNEHPGSNLKEHVKMLIFEREFFLNELLKKSAMNVEYEEELFYKRIGYKFFEDNNNQEIGSQFVLYVVDYLNVFFLEKVVIENIDSNTDELNIIADTFKSINKQDIHTQNNMNYLMKVNTQIKHILECNFSKDRHSISNENNINSNILLEAESQSNSPSKSRNKLILPIVKQISKVIDYILNIKINDMIDNIIENLLKENQIIISSVVAESHVSKPFEKCLEEFMNRGNFKKIMIDSKYHLYQLFTLNNLHLNESFSLNGLLNMTIFKTMQELIIKMLIVTVDESMMKILIKLFTKIHSQREEIINNIKRTHLIYRDKDLVKFTKCKKFIEDLSLFTEKTEIWMNVKNLDDKIDNQYTTKSINNTTKIEKTNTFDKVNFILSELNLLYYRKANSHKSIEKISLIQTMGFSLQLDTILFSLLSEICQVYQESILNKTEWAEFDKDNLNNKKKSKSRENIMRAKLNTMIKNIFKLLKNMIYKNDNFLAIILPQFLNFHSHNYLYNLGYLNLLIEIFDVKHKFLMEYGKFIFDIMKNELTIENFQRMFENLEDFKHSNEDINLNMREYNLQIDENNQLNQLTFVNENVNSYFDNNNKNQSSKTNQNKVINTKSYNFKGLNKKKLMSDLKRSHKIFKLVNKFIEHVKEEKYINNIIRLYERIIKISTDNELFMTFSFESKSKILKKINTYKMKILSQLIKISCNLIKINEKLKGFIQKIFPLYIFKEKILTLQISLDKNLALENSSINNIENNQIENSTIKQNLILKMFKNLYKLKYHCCILIFKISNDINSIQDASKLKKNFDLVDIDLIKYQEIKKQLLVVNSKNTPIENIEILNKNAFKYFFQGIFKILHKMSRLIRKELFEKEEDFISFVDELKETVKNFRSIFKEAIKEINEKQEFYKKILDYLNQERRNFEDFFGEFDIISSENSNNIYTFKIDKLFYSYEKKVKKTGKLSNLDMIMAFTEDFLSNIESYTETKNFIDKEMIMLATHLKSKIDFHNLTLYYINNNSSIENYTQLHFHLINIFLKLILEKYMVKKYHQHIIFLINLFGHFINTEPLYFSQNKTEKFKNFYTENKVSEIKQICLKYCQNLFLNNGSVEVFLKIISEGNLKFNHTLYLSILKFFNMILLGGNSDAQAKFYVLFNTFGNSDNMFLHLKQIFNMDIYMFLKTDVNIKEIKTDFFYNDLINSQLKFLQSLTENHNTNLQLFLRKQINNKVSYNMLIIIVDYMNMLLSKMSIIQDKNKLDKYKTNLYYGRLITCMETICEFLQGPCSINQENIINSKIIEIFDKILRETEYSNIKIIHKKQDYNNNNDSNILSQETKTEEIECLTENLQINYQSKDESRHRNKLFDSLSDFEKSMLIYKIGLVLLSIIEGRKTKDEVIQKLMRDFDYKLVYDKLTELYMKIKIIYGDRLEFFLYAKAEEADNSKIVVEAGLNLYVFLSSLYVYENSNSEFKRLYNLFNKNEHIKSTENQDNHLKIFNIKKAMMFYKENCLKIEILKDDQVQTVYFPRLNFFKSLNDEMIRNFRENANRSSIQTKLISLLILKDDMFMTLKQLYELEVFFHKTGPLKYVFFYPKLFLYISVTLGIIMNFLILISFSNYTINDNIERIHRFSLINANYESILIFIYKQPHHLFLN